MKKHTNIILTALAFAGMLVFASQAAIAASTKDSTPDPHSHTINNQQTTINDSSIDANNQSAADDVNDVEDSQEAADAVTNEVDQANGAADIGEDMDTPVSNLDMTAGDLGVETGDK